MSKITVANRKFLEEQVKKYLNSNKKLFEFIDPMENPEIAPQMSQMIAAAIPDEYSEGIVKDLIDPIVLIKKTLKRTLDFGGSFQRQALKKTTFSDPVLKQFFSIYQPDDSTFSMSFDTFATNPKNVLKEKLYKTQPQLIKIFETYKKQEDKLGVYKHLISFFDAVKSTDVVLNTETINFEDEKIKKMSFDDFVISLFKKEDYGFEKEDIYGFLQSNKELLLDEVKNNVDEDILIEFFSFIVLSTVDPTNANQLQNYTKKMKTKIGNTPDLNPINVTRGIIQLSSGIALEKVLEKAVIKSASKGPGFLASLLFTISFGFTLDGIDENYSIKWLNTSKSNIDQINKIIEQIKSLIETKKGKLDAQDRNKINDQLGEIVGIVGQQFRKHMESESFLMSVDDKINAYEQYTKLIESAHEERKKFSSHITPENWETQHREIDRFGKALVEVYEKYKVSLSEYSPLEEGKILKEEDDSIKEIGGFLLKIKAIQESGMVDDEIEKIIKIYNLTPNNLETKFEEVNKLEAFIKEELDWAKQNIENFELAFEKAWEGRMSSTLKSKYPNGKGAIFSKSYRRMGLFHTFSGGNGFISDVKQYDFTFAAGPEGMAKNSFFLGYLSGLEDDYFLDKGLVVAGNGTEIRSDSISKMPFNIAYGKMSNPIIVKAIEGYEKLSKKNISGYLRGILAINFLFIRAAKALIEGIFETHNIVISSIDKLDKRTNFTSKWQRPSGPVTDEVWKDFYKKLYHDTMKKKKVVMVHLKFVYAFGILEQFMSKNRISFMDIGE